MKCELCRYELNRLETGEIEIWWCPNCGCLQYQGEKTPHLTFLVAHLMRFFTAKKAD